MLYLCFGHLRCACIPLRAHSETYFNENPHTYFVCFICFIVPKLHGQIFQGPLHYSHCRSPTYQPMCFRNFHFQFKPTISRIQRISCL